MKRYVRCTIEDFIPEAFTETTVNDILTSIQDDIYRKLSPRYVHVDVDFDNTNFNEHYLCATFNVYAEGRPNKFYQFEFKPYDDYFDQIDYEAHLNQTISKFLEGIR